MSPFFQYEAVSKAGSVERGTVMASDMVDARTKLRQTGLASVLTVEPAGSIQRRRISPARLQETLGSLAILLQSGMPILAAIQSVSKRTRSGAIRSALLSMYGAVESGQSMTDAAAATGIFPAHLLAGIRVGEESGKLADALQRAAATLERENAFRRRMEGILLYPLVVFTFSMFVIGFLITFVVPRLTEIFEGSPVKLPLTTRALLAVSGFIHAAGPAIAVVLAAAAAAGWMFLTTDRGILFREQALFRVEVVRKIYVSRWLASLGTLLESGLDLVRALEVCKDAAGSRLLAVEMDALRDGLRRGRSFSVMVEERPAFDVVPAELMASGESGGKLRMVCAAASKALEEEAARQLERFAVILEPVLILSLGIFCGIIVVSVLLPIIDLSKAVQ